MSVLCLLMPLDSALYYFISSVVSVFEVDTLKLREGKRVLLVTQLLGGKVRTEVRYPQLLVQDCLSVTALPPRPVGPLLAQFSIQGTLATHPCSRIFFSSLYPCCQHFLPSGSSSLWLTLQHIFHPQPGPIPALADNEHRDPTHREMLSQ